MEEQVNVFDTKVTHRDEKTGRITHTTPYVLRVVKAKDGGRMRLYERPAGSGNLWSGANQPLGRWIKEEVDGKLMEKWDPKAEHISYVAPKTEDQKLAASVLEKDAQLEALKKELQAMKMEQEKKAAPVAEAKKEEPAPVAKAQATAKADSTKGA